MSGDDKSFDTFIENPIVRAIVGPRLDRYATRWRHMYVAKGHLDGIGTAVSWNWSAFLFGPFWLCYRRLYPHAAVIAAVLATTLMGDLYISPAVRVFDGIVFAILGTFGNALYFSHVRGKVREAETQGTEAQVLAFAQSHGGPNPVAAVGAVGLYALLVGATAALESGAITALGEPSDPAQEILVDVAGVWNNRKEGSVVLDTDRPNKAIITGGVRVPFRVVSAEPQNDIVVLAVGFPDQSVNWVLRRVWDQQGKSFTVMLTLNDNSQTPLTYVRAITDADRVAPDHLGINGRYAYATDDGSTGEMRIQAQDMGRYRVAIDTTSPNGGTCEMDHLAAVNGAGQRGFGWIDREEQCYISISFPLTATNASVQGTCRAECGMNAAYAGTYERKTKSGENLFDIPL